MTIIFSTHTLIRWRAAEAAAAATAGAAGAAESQRAPAQWRKRGRETGMEGGEGNETREREVKDRDGKRATGKRGRERGRKEGGREGGRNLGH